MDNNPDMTVQFSFGQSDVTIEGHDANEVVIRNLDFEEPPERAKGLRALYYTAEDNTGIGLSVEEENGSLKIIPASRDNGDFRLLIPNRARLVVEEVNWGGGDFEISNHNGEIELRSKSGDIRMLNITGPVIVSSTSGDVEADFSEISQGTPSSISLVSGFIDIAVPSNARASFSMSSVSGEIYTDLKLELRGGNNGGMSRLGGGGRIEGTLNGGGVEVNLKTISGNIYLRSK